MGSIWSIRACMGVIVLCGLMGCANNRLSEQQRDQKIQQSLTYRTYTNISKETLNSLIKTYSSERLDLGKSTVDESFTQALVGFMWSL